MRNDPAQFLASLGELYSIWPGYFYAIGVVIVAFVLGAFRLGRALEKAGKEGLREQKKAVDTWLEVVKQKLEIAEKAASAVTAELADLKAQIANNAPQPALALATSHLDMSLTRLLAANNAVSSTITSPGAGYDMGLFKGATLPSE